MNQEMIDLCTKILVQTKYTTPSNLLDVAVKHVMAYDMEEFLNTLGSTAAKLYGNGTLQTNPTGLIYECILKYKAGVEKVLIIDNFLLRYKKGDY